MNKITENRENVERKLHKRNVTMSADSNDTLLYIESVVRGGRKKTSIHATRPSSLHYSLNVSYS